MPGQWNHGGVFPYPWREVVDSESPDQGSYSATESMEQMLIDVDMTDFPGELSKLFSVILGFPVYDTTIVTGLRRALPMQHPFCNRLYAAKIISRRGRPNDAGVLGRKVVDATSGMSYFRYNVQRLLIQFGCPPFTILSDITVSGFGATREFYRYVEKGAEFSVENITKKGRTFKWAKVTPTATANFGLPPGEVETNVLPFDFVIRTGKAILKWTWHQVPGVALFGFNGSQVPTNIMNAIGKVNDAPFPDVNGFPAGTLLFLPPRFIAEDGPIEPIIAGVPPGFPPRVYRIEMNVSYFNPATYPNWNGVGTSYPFHGHNLQPSPSVTAMPYFYLSTADANSATNTGAFVYQSYDFGKIFRLIQGE